MDSRFTLFFFFKKRIISSPFLCCWCALSNYKAQGFFFCLFMESIVMGHWPVFSLTYWWTRVGKTCALSIANIGPRELNGAVKVAVVVVDWPADDHIDSTYVHMREHCCGHPTINLPWLLWASSRTVSAFLFFCPLPIDNRRACCCCFHLSYRLFMGCHLSRPHLSHSSSSSSHFYFCFKAIGQLPYKAEKEREITSVILSS